MSNRPEVLFNGIADRIALEISKAQRSIYVAVAWFSNEKLFNALVEKAKQGVMVRLMISNDEQTQKNSQKLDYRILNSIGDSDVSLVKPEMGGLMHNKLCIIDRLTVITGSYNWTYYADNKNHENIFIFQDKEVAETCIEHFKDILGHYLNATPPHHQPKFQYKNHVVTKRPNQHSYQYTIADQKELAPPFISQYNQQLFWQKHQNNAQTRQLKNEQAKTKYPSKHLTPKNGTHTNNAKTQETSKPKNSPNSQKYERKTENRSKNHHNQPTPELANQDLTPKNDNLSNKNNPIQKPSTTPEFESLANSPKPKQKTNKPPKSKLSHTESVIKDNNDSNQLNIQEQTNEIEFVEGFDFKFDSWVNISQTKSNNSTKNQEAESDLDLGLDFDLGFDDNLTNTNDYSNNSTKNQEAESDLDLDLDFFYDVFNDVFKKQPTYNQSKYNAPEAEYHSDIFSQYCTNAEHKLAFDYCQYFAELGNAEAQYELSVCYWYGRGVEKNNEKAVMWWQKSAKQGHARAQYWLGCCYMEGVGVKKDEEKALEWLQKSAEQGCEDAQDYLDSVDEYINEGIETSMEKAVDWCKKSTGRVMNLLRDYID